MSLPDLLTEAVEGEDVVTTVDLGGDDALVVTPSRTLVYRAEGLLSDETVEEYPHDVDRIDVSEGRRKAKLVLDYALDGERTITFPSKHLDDVLHPVLAGVLSATGITDAGESALRTFRFSELTLVVTSERLVKHIGAPVWDEEYEEFHYSDVTDLDFEEGTVATSVVLTHDGRQERFKAPNEDAPAVRRALTDAICAFHDVESLAEFRVTVADETEDEPAAESAAEASTTDFSDGLDPLSASPATEETDAAEADDVAATDATEPTDSAGVDAGSAESASEKGTAAASDSADSAASTASTASTASDAAEATGTTSAASGAASGTSRSADQTNVNEGASAGDADGSVAADSGESGRAGSGDSTGSTDTFDESGFEPAGVEGDDLAEEVAELRATVEAQTERLDRQAELIEKLVEELRRGR
ncbi:MAG: hypothetical protein ABEH81_07625 [Halopenitus sp.]